jgi:beta-galactosidase
MTHRTAPASGGFARLTAERGLLFGGDYNPEQWAPSTWREDVELMQRAGVNLVTVGVFSWATLEPEPGAREFGWLDEVLDLLHEGGIAVDLATPTASPPPWLGIDHPDTLPVDRDGVRLAPGSRNQFSPASRVYRERALAITTDLAERYRDHPAVVMWHVGNEYGQLDYGPEAEREFRLWLRERYGSIEALNDAWVTSFWSQRYRDFSDVSPPRRAPYLINPTQSLDFRRYTSDQMLRCYTELRDAIRATGAAQPITTNFMGLFAHVDYWSWASHVDVISDDQYPDPADPNAPADIALAQDLMRSLGGGAPWMLMEQAITATSWREHNLPKTPAGARLDSLQAVARGADGICFFQWRQSRAGAERFHAALLPHAGADSEVFAGACRQGADLRLLRPVVGARVHSDVALLFDWPSWWAADEPARPTARYETIGQVTAWYRVLWQRGVSVDVVSPASDLSRYRVILLPHSYIVDPATADALARAVAAGAQVVVGAFSGVADQNAHILQGRSPVLLRELLGVSGEEWGGVPDAGYAVQPLVPWLPAEGMSAGGRAGILAENLRVDDAEVIVSFADGPLQGRPAVTRRADPQAGAAWHVGTVLPDQMLAGVLERALHDAGVVGALPTVPAGLEAVRRGEALFLLNRGEDGVHVDLEAPMVDLLTGDRVSASVVVPPGDARVLVADPAHTPQVQEDPR